MDAADPLLWFVVEDDRRRKWPIYLATRESVPDLCTSREDQYDRQGITYFEDGGRGIFINAAYAEAQQNETVLHELSHAAAADMDGTSMRKEECVIEAIDKPLWTMLKQLGLRWPRKPKGYASLRRKAKRQGR